MPSSSISFHHFLALHDIYPHYFYSHLSSTYLTGLDTLNSNLGITSMRLSPISWSSSLTPPPQKNYLPTFIFRPFGIPIPGPTILILGPTLEPSERDSRNQRREKCRRGKKGGRTSCNGRAGARQQTPSKDQQDKLSSQPKCKGQNRNMTS